MYLAVCKAEAHVHQLGYQITYYSGALRAREKLRSLSSTCGVADLLVKRQKKIKPDKIL